jgi:hypothetical protein
MKKDRQPQTLSSPFEKGGARGILKMRSEATPSFDIRHSTSKFSFNKKDYIPLPFSKGMTVFVSIPRELLLTLSYSACPAQNGKSAFKRKS